MAMILTDKDLFVSFLTGVGKPRTGTITPTRFNTIINRALLNMIKLKLPSVEFSQKRIDDLEFLRVVTDGEMGYATLKPTALTDQSTPPGGGSTSTGAPTGIKFAVPKLYTITSNGILMAGDYPLYLHGLNAMFRIDDEWKGAFVFRSDTRAIVDRLVYRKPTSSRLCFEMIAGSIHLVAPSSVAATELRLEYIRYPKMIEFVDGTESYLETSPTLNQEISEFAIRQYLEEVKDPRYKSFLQEEAINSRGK